MNSNSADKMIVIASKNPVKVGATKAVFARIPLFQGGIFVEKAVSSEVREQPIGLDEIVSGAKNRAKNAFDAEIDTFCGVGIESGVFQLATTTSHYDICAASIYDGVQHHIGLSSAFCLPPLISNLILEQGLDLSQALNAGRFTQQSDIGSQEGAIGIFTKGRLTRQQYTEQALLMAVVPLENSYAALPQSNRACSQVSF